MSDLGFVEKLLDGAKVELIPLSSFAKIVDGTHQTPNYTDSGVPFVSVQNIKSLRNTAKRISISDFEKFKYKPAKGDLFMTRIGDIGTCALVENDDPLAYYVTLALIRVNKSVALPGYILHFIQSDFGKLELYKRTLIHAVPIKINLGEIGKLPIPIPCPGDPEKSLAIQGEIIRILDSFTELIAELTAELAARKKQYNHYRDQLLTFAEGDVEWKALGDVFDLRAGQHTKAAEIESKKTEAHIYPCFGGNGIRGFVRSKSHEGDYLLIGRQGALCGNVQRAKGAFYATEHAVVVTASAAINVDWAYHYLTFMNLNQYKSQSAQPGLAVGNLLRLKIPVPPIELQNQVASILGKFDTLTTSVSEGLPREIALRQQQYEYYRDLLLSFVKPAEAVDE